MKKILFLSLIVLAVVGCSNPTPPMTNSTKNEELVKQYFMHFNAHDWQKMAEMYSETAEFKDPSLGKGIVKQTRAETIKKYGELNQVFPNIRDSVIAIYPAGEKNIVVEFISSGTAPDNTTFELPICTIFTIENGIITKDFTYYDNSK